MPEASFVWVLLGDPHFQWYALESIAQARRLNPAADLWLVCDEEWLGESTPVGGNWSAALAAARVRRVYYADVMDDFTVRFDQAYNDLWAGRSGMMQPTLRHRTNMDFTRTTMVRLVALHRAMVVHGLARVVHVENDQMVYGPIQAVADVAAQCGVRLAMTKVGVRLAPATVYARDARALKDLLDFILDSINKGVEHAILVAKTKWVTDMSLPAVYFDDKAAEGDASVVTFPTGRDGSCLARTGATIYDGLPLGTWCCGSFEWPRKHLTIKMAESVEAYWDAPFEWRVVDGLRRPFWNGSAVFNLHMHSKQLHLFRSSDAVMSAAAYALVPEHN